MNYERSKDNLNNRLEASRTEWINQCQASVTNLTKTELKINSGTTQAKRQLNYGSASSQ